MKITTQDGMVFEGTQAEYEAFLAFAERKSAEQAQASETIEFEGATYRKVDREARGGDVVIFKNGIHNVPWITKGKAYKTFVISNAVVAAVTGDDGDDICVYESDYRNRTRETVDVYEAIAKAKTPKLKAGNFVKFKKDTPSITSEKPYEISVDEDGELYFIDNDGDHRWEPLRVHEYEILSAEEVKWVKIGRKPNEFKKGDIVLITNHRTGDGAGNIGTIEDAGILGEKGVGVRYGTRYAGISLYGESVELLAPVESLFNA